MKTRTLLLLSVGMGLMILLAGGVLLFQLSGQETTIPPNQIGDEVEVGDLDIIVIGTADIGSSFGVDVNFGGVEDDLTGISLVTGDRRLDPLLAPAAGRCSEITVAMQECRLEFDTSEVESSNRTLLVVRGDAQRNWKLST